MKQYIEVKPLPGVSENDIYTTDSYTGPGLYITDANTMIVFYEGIVAHVGIYTEEQLKALGLINDPYETVPERVESIGVAMSSHITEDLLLKSIAVAINPETVTQVIDIKGTPKR